jgi:hypothetical protein
VSKPEAAVLPGVPSTLPKAHVLVSEESGAAGGQPDAKEKPVLVSTSRPLWKQGWSGDASLGATPKERRGQEQLSPRDAGAEQPVPASRRRSTPDQSIYENLNPFAALRGDLDQGGGLAGHQTPVEVEHPEEQSTAGPPTYPTKKILKTGPTTAKVKKTVQYTPSTKGPRPSIPKRPPTPDFEVTIRPTSTLDILDEILAGQPSRRVDGRTIPDTLIQINEPTPVDKAKKAKRQVEPSDRVLRDRARPSK